MKKIKLSSLLLSLSVMTSSFFVQAELPKTLAWTTYDTGSAGYSEAVAIGAALKNERQINLRILPGKNDISRMLPLMKGRVQFSATGISGAYLAQEGVFEYSQEQWGPQPLRLITSNNSGLTNIALGVSVSSGIKTYEDLKGKRVAFVEGAPAVNVGIEGFLAYANLTWEDVEVVRYGGYGSAWKGLIAGDVDAMLSITNSGLAYEAAAGPHGLFWPDIDPNNTEGLARLSKLVPYVYPNVATLGANIDKNTGARGVTYQMPALIAQASTDAQLAYDMVKILDELYSSYEGKTQGIVGWKLDKQDFVNNSVPYHEGAIKYFKEKGVWSDEAQKNNDQLIARQNILKQAWEQLNKEKPDNREQAWSKARIEALESAGLDVTFK